MQARMSGSCLRQLAECLGDVACAMAPTQPEGSADFLQVH